MVQSEAAKRFMAAPLLAEIDPNTRRDLMNALVEQRATAGSTLLEQGQPNDHLSFLIGGAATVERIFPDHRTELLATLSAPALFGTTSFFQPTPPTVTVRATTDVWLLTLYHPAHEQLRIENPRAAEALAIAVVRVLAERFDLLDQRVTDHIKQYSHDHPKVTEWSSFRSRLFEEPNV
jgi:CRP/FNR family cyclic AMP-dependent transcriptional regulator